MLKVKRVETVKILNLFRTKIQFNILCICFFEAWNMLPMTSLTRVINHLKKTCKEKNYPEFATYQQWTATFNFKNNSSPCSREEQWRFCLTAKTVDVTFIEFHFLELNLKHMLAWKSSERRSRDGLRFKNRWNWFSEMKGK